MILSVSAAALAALLLSCGPRAEPTDAALPDRQSGPGPLSGASCPTMGGPTYDAFGRDFMERYCTSCHAASVVGAARMGAPSRYDFDSIEGIRMRAERIDRATAAGPAAVNAWMPESGPLPTLEEREALGRWLACGAP